MQNKQDVIQSILDLTSDVMQGRKNHKDALAEMTSAQWLRHGLPEVRERAVRTCQSLALVEMEPEIRRLLADSDRFVRLVAVGFYEILPRLDDNIVELMLPLLSGECRTVEIRTREIFIKHVSPADAVRWGITWSRHPISAFETRYHLLSPDKTKMAWYAGFERSMGWPSYGTISIDRYKLDQANGSMIWSPDSRYLAFPIWNKDTIDGCMIFLAVYDSNEHALATFPHIACFETRRFDNGQLTFRADREEHSVPFSTINSNSINWLPIEKSNGRDIR